MQPISRTWAESIFFGHNNSLVKLENKKIVEYASLDWRQREFSPNPNLEHPHIKVPSDTIVVDYDKDIDVLDFGNVPLPSAIIKNSDNNHAHLWWICVSELRGKAIQWAKDVARGLAKRLGGDRNYLHVY